MLFARFRCGWFCGDSWLGLDLMVRYYLGCLIGYGVDWLLCVWYVFSWLWVTGLVLWLF